MMVRYRLLSLAALAGLLASGCPESGPSVTPSRTSGSIRGTQASGDDHGNSQLNATTVQVFSSTEGNLETNGDVDYFRVENQEGEGILTVTTTGDTDTVGALYLPDGTQLTNDDASSTQDHHEQNFRIAAVVARGTYYVSVRGWCDEAGACETGEYVLHVIWSGTGEDDHGDTEETATQVRIPSSIAGELETDGDIDFFRLEIPSTGGLLTVTTTGSVDTYGELILPGDSSVYDDDSGEGTNFRIERRVEVAGTYYVSVAGWCTYVRCATGQYFLHVTLSESRKAREAAARSRPRKLPTVAAAHDRTPRTLP